MGSFQLNFAKKKFEWINCNFMSSFNVYSLTRKLAKNICQIISRGITNYILVLYQL